MSAAKKLRKSPKKQGPDKTWLEHQVDLGNNRSDTARLTYALRHFHDIRKAKAYEKDPSKDVSKVPSFTGWKHFKELNEMELLGVADILLRFDWNGRKAVSSIFLMADKVLALLEIKDYTWDEKWGLGRICMSALTYSGVCYLEREERGKNNPCYIYQTNNKKIERTAYHPDKTESERFPRWTSNIDKFGNRLVRPSHPCPAELEYSPKFPDHAVPWLDAVHRLESIRFRINKQLLKWVEETDKKMSTRIIPKTLPNKKKKEEALKAKAERINLERLEKAFVKTKDWKDHQKRNKKLQDVQWKDHKGFEDSDDLVAWNNYWDGHFVLQKQIKGHKAKRGSFERHLKKAQELKDKPFYQRVSVDYRGRLYLPEFSYQGSDFCRAIIEFADGCVIDQKGWDHLLRHTADVYDGLSRPTDKKVDFGKSIAPECMEIASDPIKNIDKWKDADKPFGFLRSCMEVRDAITPILRYQLEHGDTEQLKKTSRQETVAKARKWIKDHSADLKELETEDTSDHVVEDNHGNEVRLPHHSITWGSGLHSAYKDRHFVARMPVAIDQSNSAFQHIALMMDSKSLAEQTNLDNDSFHDIYQEVGDELGLKRKIIKVIIVPWSYGASTQKIQDKVIDYVDENPDKSGALSEQTEEKIKKEVKRVTKTLRKRFKVCLEYQKKVKQTIEHEFEKRSGGETLADFNKRQEDATAEIKRIKKLQKTKRNADRIKEIKESIRPPSGAIEWRTPFDFVVHQRIHVAEEPQGKVANGFAEKNEKGEIPDVDLKVRRPTDDIDWNGTRTKAPPNLVHAYDSALIHGTLWTGRFYIGQDGKGNRTAFGNPWHDNEELPVTDPKMGDPDQGLGPIVAVHDSFACYASMLEELQQVLLFNFEQIYNDYDPLERFQAEITGRKAKERKRKFKYQKSKHWAG